MWQREYTHSTSAPTSRLWALLADVDGWVNWNDGIESISLDAPLAVGATFRMTPPGEQAVTSTIVELDAPRLLTDNTVVDGVSVRVEHRLEPAGEGTTISYAVTVTGGAPDEALAEIGAGISADFPDVMANLARAAETADAPD